MLTLESFSVFLGLLTTSLALGWESFRCRRSLKRLRWRIAVTGSRGKSTLVRLLVAALRKAGYSVVAKTTGSEPLLHHIDGWEERIRRRGSPTLLEVKQALRLAEKERAEVLVVELMSLHPENLFVESVRFLQPHILLVTNVREDHLEQMGESRGQIAQSLAAAIPPGGKVLLPEEEFFPAFEEVTQRRRAEIIKVEKSWPEQFKWLTPDNLPPGVFPAQLRLLSALLKEIAPAEKIEQDFFRFYRPDPGAPRVFQFQYGPARVSWTALNAFAANDPYSTRELLNRFKKELVLPEGSLLGLLNLRADRGDRTWQWLQAMREGMFPEFKEIFVIGGGARAFSSKLKKHSAIKVIPVTLKRAPLIMEKVMEANPQGGCLVGLGNIGGLGREIINWWAKQARREE